MNLRKPLRPIPFILIAASLILFHHSSARAATDTWTGNSSANWGDAGNWTGGNSPPLSGDILVFDGSNNASTNNDLPVNIATINGLNFSATAGPFILGGNPILLGGDINDNSTNNQSIALGLLLDGATSNVNIAPAGSLSLGSVTFGGSVASTNLSTLSLNQSVSTTSLTVRTANLNANTLTIASGQTFTVTGGMTVGYDPGNFFRTTRLDISGQKLNVTGGTILIGTTSTSGAGITSTLHLAGLTEFDFAGTELNLGGRQASSTGNVSNGNLDLANTTNNIAVTTVNVGAGSTIAAGDNNNLNLGAGTNAINANFIDVGTHKSTGHIQFAGPTGSLTIRDSSGTSRANISVGIHISGGAPSASGTLNFNGHQIDLLLSGLFIGQLTNTTSTGTVNDSFSFDSGTVDVSSIKLGTRQNSGILGTVNGTLTIGGGNLIVNSTGNPNGGFSMGSNNSTASGTSSGTFVLNGGTATVYTDITKGTATTGAHIDFEGGTLDMRNHNIGSSSASIVINPASGTLKNVASINGSGSLTKNTAGTFTIDGNNAWLATNINAGTLNVIGTLSGKTNVNTGGALSGNGDGIVSGLLSFIAVDGGTTHPGTAAGDIGKISTSGMGFDFGALAIDLGPSHTADLVRVTNGLTLGLNASSSLSLTLAGAPSIGSYEIVDYGSLTKNADFAITGPAYFQYALDYSTANKVFLNVSVTRGDLTGNGAIAADDLAALEGALTDVPAYASSHGYDDPTLLAVADVNQDGVFNNADVQAEIYLLIHGALPTPSPSAVPVPEPGACLLALFGTLIVSAVKFRAAL